MIYTVANNTQRLSAEEGCANLTSYSSDHVDNKMYEAKT